MSEFGYLEAIVLGVVQGLTEFLPVSSSGHLAITQRLLDLDPGGRQMLLFDVLAHLGTLIAVGLVFARPVARFVRRLLSECSASWSQQRHAWRILLLAIAAVIPTGIIGLSCENSLKAAFDKPAWIGCGLLATGTLLAITSLLPHGRRGWKSFRWWQAALVGIAQGLAILPGVSRSGSTICMARFFGLRNRWAGEFSFLIVAPVILGVTLLAVRMTMTLETLTESSIAWGPVLVGALVSLLVGVFALRILLSAVRRAKLHYFAPYCGIVAILVLTGILWG